MIDIELVSPGGVVTVHAEDGASWSARLSAGLISDATDGLISELEGRIEPIPFASLKDKEEMIQRLETMLPEYLPDEMRGRAIKYVEASPYYEE